MIGLTAENIEYYQFKALQGPGMFHGVFSRKGGVSPQPWGSLNLGGTVGDDPENVSENLDRLLSVSGFKREQLVQVRQVHSSKVVIAEEPVDAESEGDAIATDRSGLLLLMRFADCVPVLFFDQENRAIAIAHAGWKGTLEGVVSEVVRKMGENYGTDPSVLRVGIGPSIGPDHYQIGADVIQLVKESFPADYERVLIEDQDEVKLDLWKANWIHLKNAGVQQIEISGICTGCDPNLWYSHRAERGRTGRFAAVIGLL